MSHSKPASWHPSAIGTLTRLAYAHAKANELDLKPLLKRANLRIGQINSPDARLRTSNQIHFLSLIADALRDDLLGFHLAQRIDIRELGFLYYISASSQTLGDALDRLARYTSIANEGVLLKQTFQGNVRTEFNYVGVSRHLDRHQMDFFVTALVRLCRDLIDRRIPARVRLAHSAQSGCRKLTEFFGSEIEFNAPVDDVSFDKTVKDMRIASEDPYLNRFLTDYCEQALSNRITPRSTLRADIENAIVKLLPHGQAAFGVVALRLGVSRRTLARQLTSEKLTFSGVLQDLRADLAKRYLADRSLSISQIAWLLGYREVGSFTHAFRRWTNETPKQSRSRRVAC